jgi:hypothetical protein
MADEAAETAFLAPNPFVGTALAKRPPFPVWAIVLIVPLALLALLLVVVSVLLLLAVPVPVLPPLSKQSSLSTADIVALLAGGLTGLLAVGTFVLAAYTRQAVSAGLAETQVAQATLQQAQRQVEIAQAQVTATLQQAAIAQTSLEASWRPLLTDVPGGQYIEKLENRPSELVRVDHGQVDVFIDNQASQLVCRIPFRNIGAGPAFVVGADLSGGGVSWNPASMSRSIIAAQELTLVIFNLPMDRADLQPLINAVQQAQSPTATLAYTDQGGQNRWRTTLFLHSENKKDWKVRQVAVYTGDATEPLAMSGPS